MQVYLGPLNRTTNLFVLLIVVSFMLPITSIAGLLRPKVWNLRCHHQYPLMPGLWLMKLVHLYLMDLRVTALDLDSKGLLNTTGFGQDGSNAGFNSRGI